MILRLFLLELCILCSLASSFIFSKSILTSQSSRTFTVSNGEMKEASPIEENPMFSISNVAVVLLAGGKGTRMKAHLPKQFLPILGKPVFLRSLDIFRSMSTSVVSKIIIVLDASYRDEFAYLLKEDNRISWADPGSERQDSVYNGLCQVPDTASLVAIHDAARPLVTVSEIFACLQDAHTYGAAVLGVPMKATVKESKMVSISQDSKALPFVLRTIPRASLWEIHTPQISTKSLFLQGFAKVKAEHLEVTDDVSVIEALGLPVKLTLGEYTNIKLTTPEDLKIAEQILRERGEIDQSIVDSTTDQTTTTTSTTTTSQKQPLVEEEKALIV
jgi:2-C-methyl-D-erythritol 4-phosphate cytidylyltransferase